LNTNSEIFFTKFFIECLILFKVPFKDHLRSILTQIVHDVFFDIRSLLRIIGHASVVQANNATADANPAFKRVFCRALFRVFSKTTYLCIDMWWPQLVGSLKLQVSFAEYRLFYRALLQKRPVILRSLLIVATP